MERRFLIALLLTGAVIVLTPKLFGPPPAARVAADTIGADSPAALPAARETVAATGGTPPARAPSVAPGSAAVAVDSTFRGAAVMRSGVAAAERGDTITAAAPEATYIFSASSPALIGARLDRYRSHRPADGPVELLDPDGILIDHALAIGPDTVAFTGASWAVERDEREIRYSASVGGVPVSISYAIVPDSHLVRVRGRIGGGPATLLIRLPSGLVSQETDTLDDLRSLSFAAKPIRRDAKRIGFGSLDPGEEDTIPGPLQWGIAKNKYFLVGILAPVDTAAEPGGVPFGSLMVTGGTQTGKVESHAIGVVSHPTPGGVFAYEIYAGPQEWRRLHAMGRDFENANPYGGFMQGMVQPFATIVMRALLWMKDTTALSYGWVLVLFGILVRVAIWPLQQSAMRTSIKMQRIQPEIQAVQKRYSSDQRKMQQELMRVYREHGMTPLSPLAGCLPMLLPMPVLFALFFVFQNTIEFRGVPFLWLPDISLKDPLYIIPVAMGLSMFVMSWLGMRGVPPNPQTKMMAYVMPVMMTVVFLNFASGLNLYYTVQNIVGLPQQWLIARQRGRQGDPGPAGGGSAPAAREREGGGRGGGGPGRGRSS